MKHCVKFAAIFLFSAFTTAALAQVPPSSREAAAYDGLHAAAWAGDVGRITQLLGQGADVEARDKNGRTPLHVAAFASHEDAARALIAGGSYPTALEDDRYDIITIAAVANDLAMLKLAIELGGDVKAVTSRYDGTALIAAAHLGHRHVVQMLIDAGAPLDHINNLHWTALLEAVILGDGGDNHQSIVRMLLNAGADKSIGDGEGRTALDHAKARGYGELVALLSGK